MFAPRRSLLIETMDFKFFLIVDDLILPPMGSTFSSSSFSRSVSVNSSLLRNFLPIPDIYYIISSQVLEDIWEDLMLFNFSQRFNRFKC
jgi:hypothetical protein